MKPLVPRSEQIDNMCRELAWHWKRMPELRLGQLLVNAATMGGWGNTDIFHVNDEKMLEYVRTFHEGISVIGDTPPDYDGS